MGGVTELRTLFVETMPFAHNGFSAVSLLCVFKLWTVPVSPVTKIAQNSDKIHFYSPTKSAKCGFRPNGAKEKRSLLILKSISPVEFWTISSKLPQKLSLSAKKICRCLCFCQRWLIMSISLAACVFNNQWHFKDDIPSNLSHCPLTQPEPLF